MAFNLNFDFPSWDWNTRNDVYQNKDYLLNLRANGVQSRDIVVCKRDLWDHCPLGGLYFVTSSSGTRDTRQRGEKHLVTTGRVCDTSSETECVSWNPDLMWYTAAQAAGSLDIVTSFCSPLAFPSTELTLFFTCMRIVAGESICCCCCCFTSQLL